MSGGNSGMPSVNVSGRLSAASAGPLAALRKTIDRYDGVQLDFARFEDADAAGCQHLLAMIQQILRAKKTVRLSNTERLVQAISEQAITGDSSRSQAPWLLRLELLQMVGQQAQFEEVAVDYAVTFGVSPPSWMDLPQRVASVTPDPVSEPGNDWFRVPSDIVQPAEDVFSRIKAHAAEHDPLIIDLSRVRRIDFISASQLVKLLAELRTGTQPVELRYANEMVSLLLVMMGAGEVAQLVSRR
jgi:ABC-type transporter Mla MlaB component